MKPAAPYFFSLSFRGLFQYGLWHFGHCFGSDSRDRRSQEWPHRPHFNIRSCGLILPPVR
jgi:hypothetical protein